MKNTFKYLFAAALLLPLIAPQASADRNPSATGAGHFQTDGGLRTFSFAAVEHKDGTVSGQAQLFNRGQNVRIHIAIDCLVFYEPESGDDEALILGLITSSNSPQYTVGEWAFFGAAEDAVTIVFFEADWFLGPTPTYEELREIYFPLFFPIDEALGFPLLNPIERGNIKIRP